MDFERPAEGSAIWHRERARHFAKKEPALAKTEFEKSMAIEESKLTFNFLMNIGDLRGAQEKLDISRLSDDRAYQMNPHIAKFATDSGLTV